jgi:hypothetical protein
MNRLHLVSAVLLATAAPAAAQSIFDTSIRLGPQYVRYKIEAPSNTTISEFALPLFVVVPLGNALTVDVGTAYAMSRVERTANGQPTTSEISGMTDTQVRANYTLGTDFLVLTAGINIPTGSSTATLAQQPAATLIGSDFLSFPISNMGTGLGATGGLAIARPLGDWNVGAGVSVRRSQPYDPFEQADGQRLRYEPGDEYRARIGVDRALGTGRVMLGMTFSRFTDDNIGGSIYNTGDRYVTQAAITNTVGIGDLSIVAWNLFRTAGTLADSSVSGSENITNGAISYGFGAPLGFRIEPTVEARTWSQPDLPRSSLATFALRVERAFGPFVVAPSGGFSLGRMAAETEDGTATTADLTGFRGVLTIRIR